LGVGAPTPLGDNAELLVNPIDICGSYLADTIASLIEVDRSVSYDLTRWTHNLASEDVLLVVPRFALERSEALDGAAGH